MGTLYLMIFQSMQWLPTSQSVYQILEIGHALSGNLYLYASRKDISGRKSVYIASLTISVN